MGRLIFVIAVVLAICGLSLWALPSSARGGATSTAAQINSPVDDNDLVELAGNVRPEATTENDRGPASDSFPLDHLLLLLRRSPQRERELKHFIDELEDPNSPNYHHWLTAQEFGNRFGANSLDIDTINRWLRTHRFRVNYVYPSAMLIDFSGDVGSVREAFHTEIHSLVVNGKRHFANMSNPSIPAALAPAIEGVVSLNDFRPRPMYRQRTAYTTSGGDYAVVPADLATIYDFNPLFAAGYTGRGQTIVTVEDTDLYSGTGSTSDWDTFRNVFGLASKYPSGSLSQVNPVPGTGGTCTDPGVNADDAEAAIDVEWASAAAPDAAIELASCADTSTNFGGFIALQNLLSDSGLPPAIVSISYGEAEASLGATTNAYVSSLYQQAVTEGVSVFVSSGDEGAAIADINASYATHGIAVSGYTSTPYNVSVGGTDFGDTYTKTTSTYWSSTNGTTFGSALSYVPEIPWNDSCASQIFATYSGYASPFGKSGFCNSLVGEFFYLDDSAGSGGPSGCATGAPSTANVVSGSCAGYGKPAWQSILGNPADGVRDIPDVSLFAANGLWNHYYVACYSDTTNGGAACSGTPDTWSGFGGTSISSPIMAAIQALINQRTGSRQGNPNPTYYSLAAAEYGSSGDSACNSSVGKAANPACIFYDVTAGDMDVDCRGSIDCYLPAGTYGGLSSSTSNTVLDTAFAAGVGWDFATGIGTVNANNLVLAFGSPVPTATPTTSASPSPTVGTPTGTVPAPTATATPTIAPTATASATSTPTATATPTATPAVTATGISSASSSTTTLTLTDPSTIATGQFMLACVGYYSGASSGAGSITGGTVTTSFTALAQSPQVESNNAALSCWYRIATSSDTSSTTYTITFSGGSYQAERGFIYTAAGSGRLAVDCSNGIASTAGTLANATCRPGNSGDLQVDVFNGNGNVESFAGTPNDTARLGTNGLGTYPTINIGDQWLSGTTMTSITGYDLNPSSNPGMANLSLTISNSSATPTPMPTTSAPPSPTADTPTRTATRP